ncbi:MAG: DUF4249 family protein [Haliscomenobacter sp.]|nr:DUF4249 family protein [Haliscomenobacter sp.]MBK8877360.1 DUF4249 family protein [Haliscomenobacter sp.]
MKSLYVIASRILFAAIITFALSRCTEESAILDTQTAVVEGYLFAGQPVDSLRLTQSYAYIRQDTVLVTLDGLTPSIEAGGKVYPLLPKGDGYYYQPDLVIESGKTYRLSFDWNGKAVSAETFVPAQREAQISTEEISMTKITTGLPPGGFTLVDPIEVSWENPEGDYYYVLVRNLEENPEYVNDRLAEFERENGGLRRFAMLSAPQITSFYSINPIREITQFGLHQVIVFRVTPEYAGLFGAAASTSQTITQPPTNVKNGLGILTGVSSDTLYFNVKKK